MRLVLAVALAALAAVLAVVALAAFNLRVFVESHRDELMARGARALERPVSIGTVTPSWWPIGIRFGDVVVGEDPRFGTAPFLEAGAVRVVLRPGPLVLGRVEVAAVVLDRPRIMLRRGPTGRWNVASLGNIARSVRRESSESGRARGRRRLLLPWLGLTRTEIRNGRIELEDHGGPAPRRLSAAAVRLRASELRFGGDARVRVDAALTPGSTRRDAHLDLRLGGVGAHDVDATPFTARLELDDTDLGTLALAAGRREPWAGQLARLVVEASGTLARFHLACTGRSDGGLRLGPHLPVPRIPLRVDAEAEGSGDGIRITRASGAWGGFEWTATGAATFRPWHLGLVVQGLPDRVTTVAGRAHPLRLSDVSLALDADDDLRLAPVRAYVADARVEATARLAGLEPLVIDGELHAAGFGGMLDATFDVDSGASARVHADAAGLDVGAIARRFTSDAPPVTGRGELSVSATLPWGAADPLHALSATGTIGLLDGSLAMVNVADGVLRRMPAMRFLPQLVTAATRERFPEIFAAPGTGIRAATVPFTIADGVLGSPHVLVRADAYEITATATVDTSRALRVRGDLVLSPELSTALRGDFPALRYLARGDGKLVVPFRVRGTLEAPLPEPDLKRLRVRELDTFGRRAAPRPRPSGRAAAPPREPPVVDRLERLLRP